MAYINDLAFDAALNYIDTNGQTLHICSAEPTSTAQVTSTTLGNKTSITINAPANRTPNGRMVSVAAITDGTVTATGTATHWAIINSGNTVLVATGQLTTSQYVTSGNTFTLSSFEIGFPDAV